MEGFLFKKGRSNSTFGRRNWKKRWFTLDDDHFLRYYEDFNSEKDTIGPLKGQVNILGAVVTLIPHENKDFTFTVQDSSGKSVLLCAPDEKMLNLWIAAITNLSKFESERLESLRSNDDCLHQLSLDPTTRPELSEITRAHRKLALKFHPDKGGSVKEYQNLQEAFNQLKRHFEEEEEKLRTKEIQYVAIIQKGPPGVGLGLLVSEEPKTKTTTIKDVLGSMQLLSLGPEANGALRKGDRLESIGSDCVRTWPLPRIVQRLNDFRAPVGRAVSFVFSRRVNLDGTDLSQEEEDTGEDSSAPSDNYNPQPAPEPKPSETSERDESEDRQGEGSRQSRVSSLAQNDAFSSPSHTNFNDIDEGSFRGAEEEGGDGESEDFDIDESVRIFPIDLAEAEGTNDSRPPLPPLHPPPSSTPSPYSPSIQVCDGEVEEDVDKEEEEEEEDSEEDEEEEKDGEEEEEEEEEVEEAEKEEEVSLLHLEEAEHHSQSPSDPVNGAPSLSLLSARPQLRREEGVSLDSYRASLAESQRLKAELAQTQLSLHQALRDKELARRNTQKEALLRADLEKELARTRKELSLAQRREALTNEQNQQLLFHCEASSEQVLQSLRDSLQIADLVRSGQGIPVPEELEAYLHSLGCGPPSPSLPPDPSLVAQRLAIAAASAVDPSGSTLRKWAISGVDCVDRLRSLERRLNDLEEEMKEEGRTEPPHTPPSPPPTLSSSSSLSTLSTRHSHHRLGHPQPSLHPPSLPRQPSHQPLSRSVPTPHASHPFQRFQPPNQQSFHHPQSSFPSQHHPPPPYPISPYPHTQYPQNRPSPSHPTPFSKHPHSSSQAIKGHS